MKSLAWWTVRKIIAILLMESIFSQEALECSLEVECYDAEVVYGEKTRGQEGNLG